MKDFLTYMLTAVLLIFTVATKAYSPAQERSDWSFISNVHTNHDYKKRITSSDGQQNNASIFFVEADDFDFSSAESAAIITIISCYIAFVLFLSFFEDKQSFSFNNTPKGIAHLKRFILLRSLRI